MKCVKCGTETESKFCPNCGEPMQQGQSYQQPTYGSSTSQTYANTYPIKETKKESGLGIASLVMCAVGCLGFIGLILAIVDLAKNDKTQKHNCSKIAIGVFLVYTILFIAVGGLGSNDKTATPSASITTEESTGVTSNMKNEESTEMEPTSVDEIESAEPEITYETIGVDELIDVLDNNALKAKETYKDMNVEITGKLSNIDASGKYISLDPLDSEFCFTNVQCFIKDDTVKEKVMNMSIGDTVTLQGTITDVGEILGYSLDIDYIK